MLRRRLFAVISLTVAVVVARGASHADWGLYANTPERQAIADYALPNLEVPGWLAGSDVTFVGPSGPVLTDSAVFTYAERYDAGGSRVGNQVIAYNLQTGAELWNCPVDLAAFDSWSSPGVDVGNNAVLIGSGVNVYSIDATSGAINWTTGLARGIVNASICVADNGMAYITDYEGMGTGGSIYGINLDHANPDHNAGDIVWQVAIGGTSGNSVAYHDGVVYVGCVGADAWPNNRGALYAFNAATGDEIWQADLSSILNGGEGFFGGCTYVDGYVFAATYEFYTQATMVAVHADDGAVMWSVDSERTDSIPLVVDDTIYLSAGIEGFGSHPRVQAFGFDMSAPEGSRVWELWDTYDDTGGALVVGGWTHMPVYYGATLYAGAIPTGGDYWGPYTDLYMLDTSLTPSDPGFISDHIAGMGSTPAIDWEGNLYTYGEDGLHRLNTPEPGTLAMVAIPMVLAYAHRLRRRKRHTTSPALGPPHTSDAGQERQ